MSAEFLWCLTRSLHAAWLEIYVFYTTSGISVLISFCVSVSTRLYGVLLCSTLSATGLQRVKKLLELLLFIASSFLIICPEILATSENLWSLLSQLLWFLIRFSILMLQPRMWSSAEIWQISYIHFVFFSSLGDHSSLKYFIYSLKILVAHIFTSFIDFYVLRTR